MSRDCSVPWPGRKKETSFELQESRQETDRKIAWDKCHELVLTGISSCESLRSSCREGWLGCLTFFFSLATSPTLPEPGSGPAQIFSQGFLSCYRAAEQLIMGGACSSSLWVLDCVLALFLGSSFTMFLRPYQVDTKLLHSCSCPSPAISDLL